MDDCLKTELVSVNFLFLVGTCENFVLLLSLSLDLDLLDLSLSLSLDLDLLDLDLDLDFVPIAPPNCSTDDEAVVLELEEGEQIKAPGGRPVGLQSLVFKTGRTENPSGNRWKQNPVVH